MSDQNQDQLEEQVEDQQEEQEIEYDYQEVTEDHENLFRELTDSSNESLADPEPEPEPEEEEEPEPQETASQQDQAKANVAVEQIGNKSYIDQDLINSIEDKELRQKVWNLANTAQSHYNRVYAKEQEVNKLRNEIAHLQAEQQLAARKTSTATEKKAVDEDTQRKISRLKEDYPDLSDSIEAMFQTTSLGNFLIRNIVQYGRRWHKKVAKARFHVSNRPLTTSSEPTKRELITEM